LGARGREGRKEGRKKTAPSFWGTRGRVCKARWDTEKKANVEARHINTLMLVHGPKHTIIVITCRASAEAQAFLVQIYIVNGQLLGVRASVTLAQ